MNEIDLLISSFEKEIEIQHSATLEGDRKRNNRSVKKSHKIFKKLREQDMVEKLIALVSSETPHIRLSAAVYCLPIAENLCLKTLEEIRDGNYPILSLSAEYTIKNWTNQTYHLWDE